ncbi:enoyl-CoA hydratase/isomerase family protein [Rhodococcus pyridinivorans]|nr:enoyl-CoA hydratase/isomerase family protein [Rhodococcus pyridinivorans]
MPEHRTKTGQIIVELRENGVGVVTLNRPAKLNAVTRSLLMELRDALRGLGAEAECRAVVLAGGGRAFCAGLDLEIGLGHEAPDPVESTYLSMRDGVDVIMSIREIPQPVIAAVQGHAIGAGFAFAAAADIRFCSPDARFVAPFAKLGMSAGDLGLSWLLPRTIGPGHAAELFYTGGVLESADAARLGFVQRVVDDPLAEATTVAATIATMPALGIRMTKELLNASIGGGGFREHLELEMRSQVIGAATRDHADAVRAFTERDRNGSPPSPNK